MLYRLRPSNSSKNYDPRGAIAAKAPLPPYVPQRAERFKPVVHQRAMSSRTKCALRGLSECVPRTSASHSTSATSASRRASRGPSGGIAVGNRPRILFHRVAFAARRAALRFPGSRPARENFAVARGSGGNASRGGGPFFALPGPCSRRPAGLGWMLRLRSSRSRSSTTSTAACNSGCASGLRAVVAVIALTLRERVPA
jgi:hypothetical protein